MSIVVSSEVWDRSWAEQEIQMAKETPRPWPPEKVFAFVQQCRDQGMIDWDKIASKLSDAGHVSERTRGKLSGTTVRLWYYSYKRTEKQAEHRVSKERRKTPSTASLDSARAQEKLTMLAKILDIDADESMKYRMLEQLLRKS